LLPSPLVRRAPFALANFKAAGIDGGAIHEKLMFRADHLRFIGWWAACFSVPASTCSCAGGAKTTNLFAHSHRPCHHHVLHLILSFFLSPSGNFVQVYQEGLHFNCRGRQRSWMCRSFVFATRQTGVRFAEMAST